jgi:hypothetical protein
MSIESPSTKKKRTRSPGYPTTNLADALDKAKTVWNNDGRNETPISSLAVQWGYNEKSSSALQFAAALKKFGLFEDVQGKSAHVKLTEDAIRILSDEDSNSLNRLNLLKKAALSPTIYSSLWSKYHGELPSDTTLKTYLIADLRFNKVAVDKFIRDFKITITFAKLVKSAKIEPAKNPENRFFVNEDLKNTLANQQPLPEKPGVREMRFELDCGPAIIRYPMSNDDFELLKKSLELWRPKLVPKTKT